MKPELIRLVSILSRRSTYWPLGPLGNTRLVADLVAPVGTAVGPVAPVFHHPRDGVHLEGAVGARVEAHRIENVEPGLGAEVCGVGDASADQVVLARMMLRGSREHGSRGERVVHKEAIFSALAARNGSMRAV